jgi:hypothetical protein
MAKRKPTTQEALDKLATLPDFETPPPLKIVPPLFRAPLAIPFILDQGGKAIARVLIRADPLNRIDDSTRAIINDPGIVADNQGNIVQVMTDEVSTAASKPRKVTKKMKQQRKIQSTAFKNANAKGRLQNGTFRAGFDQSRIARMAQKECTAERIRLGLCEDPKKKSKKKSSAKRK